MNQWVVCRARAARTRLQAVQSPSAIITHHITKLGSVISMFADAGGPRTLERQMGLVKSVEPLIFAAEQVVSDLDAPPPQDSPTTRPRPDTYQPPWLLIALGALGVIGLVVVASD